MIIHTIAEDIEYLIYFDFVCKYDDNVIYLKKGHALMANKIIRAL